MSSRKLYITIVFVAVLLLWGAVSHAKTLSAQTEEVVSSTPSATSKPDPTEGPSAQCLDGGCGGCEPLTHCRPCLKYEKESIMKDICGATGYKHRVKCQASGKMMLVSCDPSSESSRKDTIKFWVFEVFAVCGLILGQLVGRSRQRKHEERALKRIQKQIEA